MSAFEDEKIPSVRSDAAHRPISRRTGTVELHSGDDQRLPTPEE